MRKVKMVHFLLQLLGTELISVSRQSSCT